MMHKVRVLRVIEYVGPVDAMAKQLSQGLGDVTRTFPNGITIRAATIGSFPEVLEQPKNFRIDDVMLGTTQEQEAAYEASGARNEPHR
jgi:hypothetical protein